MPAQVIALLPKASPENGQDTFKKCMQCHTNDKGGRILTGPNLYGIVGRARATMAGFPYSEAMKSHPGNWTFEELAKYLHDPKADIPGNKMAFAGDQGKRRSGRSAGLPAQAVRQPGAAAAIAAVLRCSMIGRRSRYRSRRGCQRSEQGLTWRIVSVPAYSSSIVRRAASPAAADLDRGST